MMRWAQTSRADMDHVATHLRSADRFEAMALHGWSAHQALRFSAANSMICRSIRSGSGGCLGVAGVTPSGVVWLLSTDELKFTDPRFLRGAREWVDGLAAAQLFPVLENWLLAQNRAAAAWLRWLGFTVEEPEPIGVGNVSFCHAWRKSRW